MFRASPIDRGANNRRDCSDIHSFRAGRIWTVKLGGNGLFDDIQRYVDSYGFIKEVVLILDARFSHRFCSM